MSFGPTGSLPIASAPFLSVTVSIGRPIVFRAIPARFEFSAEREPCVFNSVPRSFTFRGRA